MREGEEERKMEEKKEDQKGKQKIRAGNSEMIIDSEQPYQETYQMRMLKDNQIPGLLRVRGCGREGAGRYYYYTENAQTLEKSYKGRDIKAGEMMKLTRQLLDVAERMKDYLLEPDGLLLSEEYVFEENGRFYFCFFPEKEKSWQFSYHELTEYFVRKVDYKDTESVLLACMLHKETLKETYDLESILMQYEEEAERRKQEQRIQEAGKTQEDGKIQEDGGIQEHGTWEQGQFREESMQELEQEDGTEFSETTIFQLDQEKSHYNRKRENLAVMEEKRYRPLKKIARRLKTGKWGEWDDLITEADDYE